MAAEDEEPWLPINRMWFSASRYTPLFVDDNSAKVLSLNSEKESSLGEWLKDAETNCTHEVGSVVLIRRSLQRSRPTISAGPSQLQKLVRLWEIPPQIIHGAFMRDDFGPQVASSPNASGVRWHALPLTLRSIKFPEKQCDPIFIFGTPQADMSSPNSAPMNVVVILEHEPDMLSSCVEAVCDMQTADLGTDAALNILRFLILNISTFMVQWEVLYDFLRGRCRATTETVEKFSGTIMNSVIFSHIDDNLAQIGHALRGLKSLQLQMQYVLELFKEEGVNRGYATISSLRPKEPLHHHCRRCCRAISAVERLETYMMLKKQTAIETVHLNSNNLVRESTIQLRRIAEQDSRDGIGLQHLSQQMAQDSRQMKRLAYLNMAFLPSAVVAVSAEYLEDTRSLVDWTQAFFSMPFMALDESLTFKAASKVWIFFVCSGLVTLASFIISYAWDQLEAGRVERSCTLNEGIMDEAAINEDISRMVNGAQPDLRAATETWDNYFIDLLHQDSVETTGLRRRRGGD